MVDVRMTVHHESIGIVFDFNFIYNAGDELWIFVENRDVIVEDLDKVEVYRK